MLFGSPKIHINFVFIFFSLGGCGLYTAVCLSLDQSSGSSGLVRGRVGMGGVMTDAIACELRVAVAMAVAVSLVCALEERLV